MLTAALVIAHKWLPAESHSFREIVPGIALTLVLSIGFGEAFGYYLSQFTRNYVSTYAGLASVMIALVFLYALASIFVFGGSSTQRSPGMPSVAKAIDLTMAVWNKPSQSGAGRFASPCH